MKGAETLIHGDVEEMTKSCCLCEHLETAAQ